jgi:hypothetical protein
MLNRRLSLRARVIGLSLVAAAAAVIAVRPTIASDHQDTPEVELNPRMDINDVFAFPGATADRIALAVTTSSPIVSSTAAGASFDPNLLYQIKVDNTGDAVEDLVFQVTFTGTGSGQTVLVRGPVKPNSTGTMNSLVTSGPEVSGAINTSLGSATGTQVFAGPRGDPFFIDLEQFFRIIPDRKPATGSLSQLPESPSASSWRNPGVDFLKGISALAIVIELPVAQLTTATNKKIGVWATISR